MKKIIFSIVSLMGMLMLSGYTTPNNAQLQGFYQSERSSDGYVAQISILANEKSFIEYIDNREVNRGTYDVLSDNKYKLVGDNQTIEITLDKNNSFEIIIKKVNGGNPIILKNIDKVPVDFSTQFNDIDKYEALIEE